MLYDAPSPRLPELKPRLDNPFKVRAGLLGCPVKGQEMNSMILVSIFQLRIFCENASYWCSGIWKKHSKFYWDMPTVPFWAPWDKKEKEGLECIQGREQSPGRVCSTRSS